MNSQPDDALDDEDLARSLLPQIEAELSERGTPPAAGVATSLIAHGPRRDQLEEAARICRAILQREMGLAGPPATAADRLALHRFAGCELPMTTGEVGRFLNMSSEAVRTHDADLAPIKTRGGQRLYDPARVRDYAAARSKR